jgi:hypothetical protein
MKKAKSKSKPTNNDKEGIIAEYKKIHDALGYLPTIEQLAMIAATLGRGAKKELPGDLIDAAFELWKDARNRIVQAIESDELQKEDSDFYSFVDHWESVFPMVFKHEHLPIARDDFLKVVFPHYTDRPDKLAQISKAFLRDSITKRLKREATPDEVSDAYENWTPFQTEEKANTDGYSMRKWYKTRIENLRRTAGEKSAAKKKLKKKL